MMRRRRLARWRALGTLGLVTLSTSGCFLAGSPRPPATPVPTATLAPAPTAVRPALVSSPTPGAAPAGSEAGAPEGTLSPLPTPLPFATQAPAPMAATAGPAPTAASAPGESQPYVVQQGDTLTSISLRFYGRASLWRRIYDANRDVIPDPNALKVGTRLLIPAVS